MKAAIYAGGGGAVSIETLPDPVPAPGEVIIKTARCGICGTDLSMTRGGMFDFGPKAQFGHEYAGEVVALGAGTDGWRIGDHVVAIPSLGCGSCSACDHGNNVLCRTGGSAAKGFADYAAVPMGGLVRLPQSLSLADGALIEPLAVSLYGLKHADMKPGARVLVLGGGTVALYAIWWARRMGAGRIVCMSRSSRRANKALAMGADAFLPFGPDEAGEAIEALQGPADLVLECAGAEGMMARAISHVKPFGRIVSLGFCTAPDPIMPALASYKCADLRFLVGYGPDEFRASADAFDKGHADPRAIITNVIPLDDLPAMMTALRGANSETKVQVGFA